MEETYSRHDSPHVSDHDQKSTPTLKTYVHESKKTSLTTKSKAKPGVTEQKASFNSLNQLKG